MTKDSFNNRSDDSAASSSAKEWINLGEDAKYSLTHQMLVRLKFQLSYTIVLAFGKLACVMTSKDLIRSACAEALFKKPFKTEYDDAAVQPPGSLFVSIVQGPQMWPTGIISSSPLLAIFAR